MPQFRKGKGKTAKPLVVPNLDNRPRYETPDTMQLPTPGPTPRVQLPTIGFRDSENEEQFDRWEEEQRIEKFKRMGKREWEQVGRFLLQHTICFLKDTFFDTELSVVETILGENVAMRADLAQTFDLTRKDWEGQLYKSDTDEARLVEEERIIGGLKNEILCLSKERDVLDTELSHLKQTLVAFADQGVAHVETIERLEKEIFKLRWEKEKWVEREEMVGKRSKKILVSERKKWQAECKALPVETVSVGTQSDHIEEGVVKVQAEVGVQTEMGVEKEGAGDSDDIVMADGSSMDEDLSAYEDEDEAPAAPRLAAKAGKKSRPAKTPPQNTPPSDNSGEKAIVIHGVPCQRPMADIIQDVGVRGILGARWLLRGNRRFGKATSSVVVFFERKLAVGSHLKMRGRWLPIEAYVFQRGRKRLSTPHRWVRTHRELSRRRALEVDLPEQTDGELLLPATPCFRFREVDIRPVRDGMRFVHPAIQSTHE
ncbi:hypothetical protein EV426DRAFT_721807 [Tirmania nivea]|nr:hypothetical protein EV426DRAFT_721807 [Tirmania nivea]